MINWLIRNFIKNSDQVQDPEVRTAYGKFSGVVGIMCNLLLFAGKFIAGILSGAVSIQADAVNNLSDASSSIISLLGFKMAGKPADAEHPYGHARYEYLSGLAVSVIILLIGAELFKSSFDKILHPSAIAFSLPAVMILICSIAVKLWMAYFNWKMGKRIQSETLIAAAADSRNDVISTSAVLCAMIISSWTDLELDGFMGVLVALFVIYSGVMLIKETSDPLLGKAPDPQLVLAIRDQIMSYPGVLGTHDLMLHDYGPGRQFGSVHVEMAAEQNVLESHEIIDTIERDFLEKNRIHMVVHYDPIVTEGDETANFRGWLAEQVKRIHPQMTVHDLRMVPGVTRTNVIFDCVIPMGSGLKPEDVKEQVRKIVQDVYPSYQCIITIDQSYAAIPH